MGELTVLFFGATGRFSSLAPLLLNRGHRVLAGTRDAAGPAAQRLRDRGAEIVTADFDDVAALEAAVRRADAIVAAGTAHAAGPAGDVRHGRNIIDAAASAGTGHLVYLTVAGADRPTGVSVMDSKHAVEEYLRAAGVRIPSLRRCTSWRTCGTRGTRRRSPQGGCPARYPGPGRFSRSRSPTCWRSPCTSWSPAAPCSASASRSPRTPSAQSKPQIPSPAWLAARVEVADLPGRPANPLFAWLEHAGARVDIAALRSRYREVAWHTFADWAATQDWHRLQAAASPRA